MKINLNNDYNLLDRGNTIINRDNNDYSTKLINIIIKLIITLYGKWMIRQSWASKKSYNNNLSSLDTIFKRLLC